LETVSAAFPHLEILEFVGQGGMGIVFKTRQPKLDRFVALKLLPQKPGADPSFGERFNREARVLARLSHPNIVAVHDFGQAGTFFYLLMEFVDGVNLRQAMRAGRFTPAQALALVPKICDALQYAHEEGILHRDIKPENLLLDTRGRLKIADFGIAKLLGDVKDITLTASGASIGTPHYMAPEQLERPHDVDQRADVYSLGVVFYEMLTGELPIGRFAPPSEKNQMDPRVDQVVLRALEKERERRFQSAGDVKTQVERITANPAAVAPGPTGTVNLAAVGAQPPPLSATSRPISSPRRLGWSMGAIAGAGLAGLSLVELLLMVLGIRHVGPREMAILFALVAIPALVGALLSWYALSQLRRQSDRRGGRLALLGAVVWPLLILDALTLLIPVRLIANLQWHVFHVRNGAFTGFVAVIVLLAIFASNVWLVRYLLRRWKDERMLPHSDFLAQLGQVPRSAYWLGALVFVLFVFVLFVSEIRMHQAFARTSEPSIQQPNLPPGYISTGGGMPGNDGRVYRSAFTVPPGYVLTVSAVLCSNQIVMRDGWPNASASLLVPEGLPAQGHLSWHLLGNTRFADGAPLQFSCGLDGPEAMTRSFHVLPPEPIDVDWVGDTVQIWPPQNGRTRFLLIKGYSANTGPEAQSPVEWAVGIETRLDPIPANLLREFKRPVVELGTNWFSAFEAALPSSTSTAPPGGASVQAEALSKEKISEYRALCTLLDSLAVEQRELLLHFPPESMVAKGVREQIVAKQKLKKELEEENPELAQLKLEPVLSTSREK
jgi:tRNA A-37 threonylcarbamoyl transferase component Bud32